jgi:hypothetical protein
VADYYGDQIIGPGTHAGRPAVTAVAEGALFVCEDDDVVEVNTGAAWIEWFDPESAQ